MATDTTEPRTESAEDLAKRFAHLVSTWRERTAFSSKIKTRIEHPAFREIVAMGEPAIPLILADLEKNGGFGFLALAEITGANPIPENSHVNNDEWATAWLAWGREKGFR
jgi:hypothetical protein